MASNSGTSRAATPALGGNGGSKLSTSWLSLFSFMTKKHVPTLILAILFALGAGLVPAVLAILLGNLFNSFTLFEVGTLSAQGLLEDVTKNCLGLLGLGAGSWFLNGTYFTLFIIFGELQAGSVRGRLFGELLGRDLEWFESQKDGVGAFLNSIQAQVHEVQMATSQPLGLAFQYSFRTLASLGLALYTSWNLSLVTLAGVPIFSAVISFLSTRIKSSINSQQHELTKASKVVNSTISSIDTVKCHNAQKFEAHNFACKINAAATHYLKQAHFNSLQISLIRLMMFGMFVQGFWYGSALAASGKLSAGEVLRTFWACLMATQSIEQVLPQAIPLEQGKVAAASMKYLLESRAGRNNGNEMKGAAYPRHCEGDIEIRNLSFSYPSQPEKEVLKSSSFFFPAGEITFVIGKSGSGKSTLSSLLTRFYLADSGEILIDGVPIQMLDINWIRNNITLLEQKSVLFNESILTNIAFGRRDYDEIRKEDVQGCIDLAMLQSTIDGLPQGIDTCVGYGGSFLSGGQRQRVAIARARLRDTPILILDEPTSALDSTNRIAIMKATREWRKGKTTIIITHDMSQILEGDFVYILEHGSVVQAGYRSDLEKRKGNEKSMFFTTKESSTRLASEDDDNTANMNEVPDLCFESASSDSGESLHNPESGHLSMNASNARRVSVHDHRVSIQLDPQTFNSYLRGPRMSFGMDYVQQDRTANPSRLSSIIIDDRIERHSQETRPDEYVGNWVPHKNSSQTIQMIELPRSRGTVRSIRKQRKKFRRRRNRQMASIYQILLTIVPNLTVGQRLLLSLGFLSALAHASAVPIFSYCLAQIFGSFYVPGGNAALAMKWSLAILGVAIGDGLISYSMHYFLEFCGQAWVDALRKKAFHRVLDQPRSWFEKDKNKPLRLAACLDQNGEEMRNLVGRFSGFVIVAFAITIMAAVWSLIVCWKLTLVALACGPIIYAITRGFEKTNGMWETRCSEASGALAETFAETFSEIRTVRTLTLEAHFHKKHIKAASRCMTMGLKRAVYTGLLFGIVESTIVFVAALINYYGAVLASSREFTVQDIMTVLAMLQFSIGYASTVLSWIPQINTSRDTATQLLRLANLPEGTSHEHLGQLPITRTAPVKFTNLSFRYPSRPETLVLRNVSLAIPANSCTAIVGRSGSGKSTIASLLLSLYEAPPSRDGTPTISLGSFDIRNLHTPTLRNLISIVSQQPTIFPDTIRANISYGLDENSPLNTLANVRAAAEAAGIDEFISSLPKGYYTVIGDGGIGISGGQAQRLVIARALMRQPQMLILDEATSSLDVGSAEVIRQTVQKLVACRPELTVIIITHSKEMMEIANTVIVLEQGVVVEQGPYRVLTKRLGGKLKALMDDPESE